MKLLFNSIAKGTQHTLAEWTYGFGELRLRIRIRSDNCDFQGYARADMWDAVGTKWSPLASVHYGEMKTEPDLYLQRQWNNESCYREDLHELLRRAVLIVPALDGRDDTALLEGWRITVGPGVGGVYGAGRDLFIWREGRVGSLNVKDADEGFEVHIWDSDASNEVASCSAPYTELDSYGQLKGGQ